MEDLLYQIATSSDMPIWGSAFLVLLTYYGKEIKKYVQTRFFGEAIDRENHRFFKRSKYYLRNIDDMIFHDTNKNRNLIVRDFVQIKIRTHMESLKGFIKKYQEEKDSEKMCNLFLKMFKETVETSNAIAMNEGIPKIFIDKYLDYRRKDGTFFYDDVSDLFCSPIHSTNKQTLVRVLDLTLALFETFLMDAEKAIANINGELDNIEYKGAKIGPGEKTNYLFESKNKYEN